ncbi:reprolysin-like metallopeptidase [Maribacter sp. R77961]|uniref:reprolysin-like metallopeptidase n=1 Tax=Maribacter sp. R77961 TaxID=3093871 RepID=UPI0037C94645
MITKLRLVFSITIAFLSFYGAAQSNYWKGAELSSVGNQILRTKLSVEEIKVFNLDDTLFRAKLAQNQVEHNSIVYFPDDSGKQIAFSVSEANVFSKELSVKYPNIKSYRGKSMDNSTKRIHFSVSPKGIQSMMTGRGEKGMLFMQKGIGETYVLYNRNKHSEKDNGFICKTAPKLLEQNLSSSAKLVDDRTLRKFRVAIAASGEYTNYHGGTKADALAAINATLTRVNGIFERDLGVTLELIGTTDEVIYTDGETDPFTGSLSSQTQNVLTSVLGEASYDIGHLFNQKDDTLDGNSGFIGSVCRDNRKGSAYATFSDPEGDLFDIDLVAHEIGHQFGANHTFSHLSEGTSVQVEPGSGTTIMGYAGITGVNNVASNSDDYFHYASILQIREYLETVSCGETIDLTNVPPVLNPVQNYIIPRSTAFVLTGNASDTDVGDIITYAWEQIDNGIITQATFGPTSPTGAMFRSFPPTTAPERYFPNLDRILSGNLTQTNPGLGDAWETVSEVERNLNFSLTVRDNALNGGQLVSDEVSVLVSNDAGPFVVTSQNVALSYIAGEVQTISWDVANTNLAPISAETVDIFLSTDGGLTYPTLVAENVLNDGTHDIVIPAQPTSSARFMIRATNNIFFAVNSVDFSIVASEVVLNFNELEYEICKPDDLVVSFNYETYLGFSEESSFSIASLPTGLNATFSPLTASTTNTPIAITFSGTNNVPIGSYPLTVRATSPSITKELEITLNIYDTTFSEVVLVAPTDGILDASKDLTLEWESNVQNTSYELQIATDAAFTNIVESPMVRTSFYMPTALENNTQYFWRIKPVNGCGEGVFGTSRTFTTIDFNCISQDAFGLPLDISSTGTPTIISRISFFEDLPLADLNVNLDLEHSFLADLVVSLTSPAGTTVVLVSSSCGEARNINAIFDDDALPFTCTGNPAVNGMVRPLGTLSSFNGESILGEWILEVKDNAPSDGGRLNSFSLEVCVEGDFRPDADNDGVFDDGDDLCLDTPTGQEVDASGCPIFRFPTENFSISLQSETCRPNNDGQIQIEAKVGLDYEVIVTGEGVNVVQNFTDSFMLPNLSAGTYAICITGTDGTIIYEEECLDVVIMEPDILDVSAVVSLDNNALVVNLQGSTLYNVELNGIVQQTELSEIALELKDGVNVLKVSTNLPCQGVYEEEVVVASSSSPVVFPNPFSEYIDAYLGTESGTIMLNVFSVDGRLVKSQSLTIEGPATRIDLSELLTGLYYVQFLGSNSKGTVKVIKR